MRHILNLSTFSRKTKILRARGSFEMELRCNIQAMLHVSIARDGFNYHILDCIALSISFGIGYLLGMESHES